MCRGFPLDSLFSMGRSLWIIAQPNETECGCSSTATERPNARSGDAGSRPAFRFLSHSTFCPSSFLDGPLSLGYLVSGQPRVGSYPAPSGNRWVPNSLFVRHTFIGPNVIGYLAKWQSAGFISRSCRFEPCDPDTISCPIIFCSSFFDGSQDWVIAHNDVVAGSSPASGTRRRSSSAVEHVISSSNLIRRTAEPDFGSLLTINHKMIMRPDMHKVVMERPRWNPGRNKRGRRANLPYELLPKFEGIKRPYIQRKALTDLLGPLRRWLHSQVGRPWNDVYSEACAVIKPDSVIRAHIKTHLLEFVERHTFMQNEQVCILNTSRGGGITPVTKLRWGRQRFFVHPETGLLHEMPKISKRAWQAQNLKPAASVHWVKENLAIKQIRGLWYECHYEVIHSSQWVDSYDHALERIVARQDVSRNELLYQICTRKHQLSKHELRRLGLRNAPENLSDRAQYSIGCTCRRLNTVLQFFAGRRLWVIGTRQWGFNSVPRSIPR